ncbi:hypothetical protein GCM10012275_35100 [Longimycelium tulufanense]|uniref:Thiopeptide-type bacteriocin biosynthesis domain-containing protein n=2 Tax=Longimycelium tulufanense TaxID=907463 RepID=A0A8J3CCZ2_9PSEU|nr:hypothetical protein GCM10012275_35100 [Longimycelium tulufanense]
MCSVQVSARDAGAAAHRGALTALRVYSHADSLRDLVAGLADVGAWLRHEHGVYTVFLQRGWLHGSHVDLVTRAEPGRHVPEDELRERVQAVARELPEGYRSEQDYLRTAAEFGAMEQVPPPYLPLLPHRTVSEVADSEVNPWQGEVAPLRESALARMFEPVRLTLSVPTRSQVLSGVAEAFAALAESHPWGIAFGSFSFRSHAEAFLHWQRGSADVRIHFDHRLATDRPRVERVVRAVLEGGESCLAARWRSAFAYCAGQFDAAVESGVLNDEVVASLAPSGDATVTTDTFDPSKNNRGPSEFHAAVTASRVTSSPGSWFIGYRLLLNLFYRQLPLLDISPLQRFYLCYALAEVTDEVTGETWRERLERVSS